MKIYNKLVRDKIPEIIESKKQKEFEKIRKDKVEKKRSF
jgi:predicted house-cleaning noncanonical NTP pyrophosphatase (MazG superfamily)